jgi:hypothetical protein
VNSPVARLEVVGNTLDESGFPGTIGTSEPDYLIMADRKAYGRQCRESVGIMEVQVLNTDNRLPRGIIVVAWERQESRQG